MGKTLKKLSLWIIYAVFAALAIGLHDGEPMFAASGPYAAGKYIVWAIYFAFLGYSIYCTTQENFFKTLGVMAQMHWARQVGIDLYIGLIAALFLMYLVEGSLFFVALWLVPVLIYANLAIFLYFALNYGAIVALLTTA